MLLSDLVISPWLVHVFQSSLVSTVILLATQFTYLGLGSSVMAETLVFSGTAMTKVKGPSLEALNHTVLVIVHEVFANVHSG